MMEETQRKFILPSPCFKETEKPTQKKLENSTPCLAVPQGDLLPTGPPMYGPRGPTIPPRFLGNYQQKYNHGRNEQHSRGFSRNFNNHRGQRFQYNNQHRQTQSPTIPNPNYQNDFTQQFWCETCDRPFKSSAQLESHKFEHQICGIDDCMFIGHPSVVAKHIEAQHTTGLYQKIKNLSTVEEIEKWREERKKRYPTKANVEIRQKAQAERMKRGEKLSEKKSRFGQQSDRRQMDKSTNENTGKVNDQRSFKERNQQFNKNENSNKSQQVGNNRKNRRKRLAREKRNVESAKIVEIKNKKEEGIFNGNLKMFEGTLSMLGYHPEMINKSKTNALTSLLGMYGSSSENETDDDGEQNNILNKVDNEEYCDFFESTANQEVIGNGLIYNKDVNVVNENITIINVQENNSNNNEYDSLLVERPKLLITSSPCSSKIKETIDSDDIPDEEPIIRKPEKELLPTNPVKQEPSTSNQQPPTKRSRPNRYDKSISSRKNTKNLLDYSKLRARRQNTMLEKLLESDIRHERNVLLQCVRYVVKNDFFGIGNKNT